MHIFLAGAGGAAGRALIPLLATAGHRVTGTTRSASRLAELAALGAEPVVLDGLDGPAVVRAVTDAAPDVVVHQMTALAAVKTTNFDKAFAVTNRLRTEGTDHLLAAARATGALMVAQSFAGWPSVREGGPVKDETAPLDPNPPTGIRASHAAIRHTESTVTAAGGIVLRYGGFYGPGTGLAPGGNQYAMVARRRMPVVGDGGGVWSLVHVDDVAAGTLAAIEHGRRGEIYNIVDDDPAPVREWLPYLARTIGAKPPRHVPAWLARLVAGEAGLMMMTQARGASNAKARAELGWTPAWPSWRQGFAALTAQPVPTRIVR